MDTIGKYEELPFIKYRKVVTDMVELASEKHQMSGGMDIDVTSAREKLRLYKASSGESQSFTAWFVKCVAQAVAENKQIHGIRKGRKVIVFDDIDILIMVETIIDENQVALPYVVRKADKKGCKEIHNEIRAAQKQKVSDTAIMIGNKSWPISIYPYLPKTVRLLIGKMVSRNPFYVKKNTGTVAISSIGMMGKVNGWISPISPLPLSFSVCGITKTPGIVGDKIEVREVLKIAFTVDHDFIDGAPFIRFLSRLGELLEASFDLDFLS